MAHSTSVTESVVEEWCSNTTLKTRGSTVSKLAVIAGKGVTREDVRENKSVLLPIIKFLGMKPNIDSLNDCTWKFLTSTRPRGKPDLSGACFLGMHSTTCATDLANPASNSLLSPFLSGGAIRKEAWKVRRLMSVFSRAARRPHWPRDVVMQELFLAAGLDNPNDGVGH